MTLSILNVLRRPMHAMNVPSPLSLPHNSFIVLLPFPNLRILGFEGYWSIEGSKDCTPCRKGTHGEDGKDWRSRITANVCIPCAEATFSEIEGSKDCEKCTVK